MINGRSSASREDEGEGGDYVIDGVMIHVDHDPKDYLEPSDDGMQGQYDIDMVRFLHDVLGYDITIILPDDGFIVFDESGNKWAVTIVYNNTDWTKMKADAKVLVSRVGKHYDYCSTVEIDGVPLPVNISYKENRLFCLNHELAVLTFYLVEQTEKNPRDNVAGELGLTSYICGDNTE